MWAGHYILHSCHTMETPHRELLSSCIDSIQHWLKTLSDFFFIGYQFFGKNFFYAEMSLRFSMLILILFVNAASGCRLPVSLCFESSWLHAPCNAPCVPRPGVWLGLLRHPRARHQDLRLRARGGCSHHHEWVTLSKFLGFFPSNILTLHYNMPILYSKVE